MSEAAARCCIMAAVKSHDDVWKDLLKLKGLSASFGEDQQSSFGDYLELAMQSQYNKRNV